MSRWLFPIGLLLILAGAAVAHYEMQGAAPGTAPGGTRTRERAASPDPGGAAGATSVPVPQVGGSGQP